MWHSLAILGHLDFAATLGLKLIKVLVIWSRKPKLGSEIKKTWRRVICSPPLPMIRPTMLSGTITWSSILKCAITNIDEKQEKNKKKPYCVSGDLLRSHSWASCCLHCSVSLVTLLLLERRLLVVRTWKYCIKKSLKCWLAINYLVSTLHLTAWDRS